MEAKNVAPMWLKAEQKKGQTFQIKNVLYGILALVFLGVIIGEMGGDIFSNLTGLENNSDVPSWIPTILILLFGFGIVFIGWKLIEKYT